MVFETLTAVLPYAPSILLTVFCLWLAKFCATVSGRGTKKIKKLKARKTRKALPDAVVTFSDVWADCERMADKLLLPKKPRKKAKPRKKVTKKKKVPDLAKIKVPKSPPAAIPAPTVYFALGSLSVCRRCSGVMVYRVVARCHVCNGCGSTSRHEETQN